jgi:oligopeptide/dipeptide ABC transporter ATP-binding protein
VKEEVILRVKDLRVSFKYGEEHIQVVRGFNLELKRGEIVGILGESGSGKSVSSMSIIRLTEDDGSRVDSGSINFKGKNLLELKEDEMRKIRGKEISYIFQDASAALNPYQRCGKQIEESLKIHGLDFSKEKILEIMMDVGLDNAELIYDMFPPQLSGGQCQRVMIAIAIASRPEILIADEPTTAIDASLQRKVLKLLGDINKKYGMAIIVITHDFDVAREICSRVAIMYGGLVMEEGKLDEVLNGPLHPYTGELLRCVNSLDENDEMLYTLQGMPPGPLDFKEECPFYSRCKVGREECLKGIPEVNDVDGRRVRCFGRSQLNG